MNLENAEYDIGTQDNQYVLLVDEKPMTTPAGKTVSHTNYKLLEHIMYELECVNELSEIQLSTFSLYATMVDIVESKEYQVSKEMFRMYLINDPTLSDCAGPERVYQYQKWRGLFDYLELIDIKYPGFIQVPDVEAKEEWISTREDSYQESISKLVDLFYREYNLLSSAQKAVVNNCIQLHGTPVYGIMLATKKCNEMDYTAAILASHGIIPNVFGDVDRAEYKEAFYDLKSDASILTNFLSLILTPDIDLQAIIKSKLPNWSFLPEGSRFALSEALHKIHLANSDDYSSYVLLMGKAIEITLKTHVFDEYQRRFHSIFEQEINVEVFIKENHKIERLAKFLVKEPHFIELGTMLVILEKYGGRTAKNNEVLGRFFEFIENELHLKSILEESWLNNVKIIKDRRNKAAHDKRFTLDEAKEVMDRMFEVIQVF